MGYLVSSIFSVKSNDKHSYFIYFIPGNNPYRNLSSNWINDWVYDNFNKIAISAGPEGVVILNSSKEDRHECYEWPFMDTSDEEDDILHRPFPFLLVSQTPLMKNVKPNGIAINLIQSNDKNDLAKIFDNIIKGIKKDNWEYILESFPEQLICYPYFRQVPLKITQPFDILAS